MEKITAFSVFLMHAVCCIFEPAAVTSKTFNLHMKTILGEKLNFSPNREDIRDIKSQYVTFFETAAKSAKLGPMNLGPLMDALGAPDFLDASFKDFTLDLRSTAIPAVRRFYQDVYGFSFLTVNGNGISQLELYPPSSTASTQPSNSGSTSSKSSEKPEKEESEQESSLSEDDPFKGLDFSGLTPEMKDVLDITRKEMKALKKQSTKTKLEGTPTKKAKARHKQKSESFFSKKPGRLRKKDSEVPILSEYCYTPMYSYENIIFLDLTPDEMQPQAFRDNLKKIEGIIKPSNIRVLKAPPNSVLSKKATYFLSRIKASVDKGSFSEVFMENMITFLKSFRTEAFMNLAVDQMAASLLEKEIIADVRGDDAEEAPPADSEGEDEDTFKDKVFF